MFFREFGELFKNTFFTEHLWPTASAFYNILGEEGGGLGLTQAAIVQSQQWKNRQKMWNMFKVNNNIPERYH